MSYHSRTGCDNRQSIGRFLWYNAAMFERVRQLNVSLARKCQLLFGSAVVLIIAAALYVPWQRIEQLMDQMNERTAHTLSEWAEAEHLAHQTAARASPPAPATGPAMLQPTNGPSASPGKKPIVRMLRLYPDTPDLSRFELKARRRFTENPDAAPLIRTQEHDEGPPSYLYARALHARQACMICHEGDLLAAGASTALADNPPAMGVVSVQIPYQVDANQVFLNRFFIFLAGLLAGTLAIIVFYLITTRLILGPVRVLQETAEKVAKGDLNIRSHISTGDEFQQLSETFNTMLGNLQDGEEQLRAINTSLDLKINQLAESNLALYESNRLKSEFLANVSHELRTPLNSILGFADLLKDVGVANDLKAGRYLQNIIGSGKHLLGLITDLLDLAKIEAGRMEVRAEPLSLSDLFEGLTSIIRPLAEKKQLLVAASVARDVPVMQTDPGKLQQVLYNFLSNAIKFSPTGGRVELRAERSGEEDVKISVMDEGPGIEPEKQGIIFEKFRQVDASVTREHSGTGLGLAISKELTVLMGGSIGVQSRPGEGATFWVTLPVKVREMAVVA
jgi:two-component system, NarL family, sensor histidine kinase BarA